MTYGENDDVENEEMDSLQSYARKGMAQEMAKKLGLLGDVPGADSDMKDAGAGGEMTNGGEQTSDAALQAGKNDGTDGIDLDELLKILQTAQ